MNILASSPCESLSPEMKQLYQIRWNYPLKKLLSVYRCESSSGEFLPPLCFPLSTPQWLVLWDFYLFLFGQYKIASHWSFNVPLWLADSFSIFPHSYTATVIFSSWLRDPHLSLSLSLCHRFPDNLNRNSSQSTHSAFPRGGFSLALFTVSVKALRYVYSCFSLSEALFGSCLRIFSYPHNTKTLPCVLPNILKHCLTY